MLEFTILILLPLLSAAVCRLAGNMRAQHLVSLAAAVAHLSISFLMFIDAHQTTLPFLFSTDALSKLFLLILSNVYFWIVLVSRSFLLGSAGGQKGFGKKYYFALLNFYLFANTAAILSNHFGMYWVAAEATTLSVAPLVYYYRTEEALEAMWKYLFLVSVGIAFAFIGILFLALSANGSPLEGGQLFFTDFVRGASKLSPVWLKASFIFIFVGLSTKIGIAPMHSGDIDATSNAPSPVAALMSGSLRITALLGLLRIIQIIRPTDAWSFAREILVIGGLLSVFVAFLFMFKVKNYKRMLAYSSVEHLGIITLGIGTGGLAFAGAMYHCVYNSITKVVLFLAAGNIHRRFLSREVDRVGGVLGVMPWTGWICLFAFLAISALPPFGIFFSELMIFEGMLFSDKPWVLAVLLVVLLFIFINMGNTLFRMLYRPVESGELSAGSGERFGIVHFASIALLAMMILVALARPDALHDNIAAVCRDFGVQL